MLRRYFLYLGITTINIGTIIRYVRIMKKTVLLFVGLFKREVGENKLTADNNASK